MAKEVMVLIGARINSISPGIIVTSLAVNEFNGARGDFLCVLARIVQ